MIKDTLTIVKKEWREILLQSPGLRGGRLGLLVFIGVFGIFLPLQSGPEWLSSPANLFIWGWVPFLMVSGVVADSFAGERERHTLETLLASRLSDRSILAGKILAALGYGWGITLVSLLVALLTINIAYGRGELLLFPWKIGLAILLISLLVASLAAGLGVLISLRAATVRQAQQTFSLAFFALFIPLFLLPMLPEAWRLRLTQALAQANVELIVLVAMLVLLLVDLALFALASARFQRTRLILDE
ncbi:MAG TPA: ABC transporter permease [Anaerolineales bacterium]|nr:ABC transporter permease [Anaerolineales bacterium]